MYPNEDNDEYFNTGELPAPSTFITTTGAFGTKNIFVSTQYAGSGCAVPLDYSTDVFAYSGTASGKITISAVSTP